MDGLSIISSSIERQRYCFDIDSELINSPIFNAKIFQGNNFVPITEDLDIGLLIGNNSGESITVVRRSQIIPSLGGIEKISFCSNMEEYTEYMKGLFAPYQSVDLLKQLFSLTSWQSEGMNSENKSLMFLMLNDRSQRNSFRYFGIQSPYGTNLMRDCMLSLRFPACVYSDRFNQYVFPTLLIDVATSSPEGGFSFDSGEYFDQLSFGGDAIAMPSVIFDEPLVKTVTHKQEIVASQKETAMILLNG